MLKSSMMLMRFASTKAARVSPEASFDFIPATTKHIDDLLKLCTTDFIYVEPHSKALKLQSEACKGIFQYLIEKSLHYPYSYAIYEKGTKRIIGFRLMSVGHRDHSLDYDPFPLVIPENSPEEKLIFLLTNAKEKCWEVCDPSVKKVIRREITFVTPEHQRKGIAKYLLHLGLDFDQLRREGFDGITSEASSLANQTLLANNGYKCLVKPNYKLEMHDGNEGIKAFFKDLRQ